MAIAKERWDRMDLQKFYLDPDPLVVWAEWTDTHYPEAINHSSPTPIMNTLTRWNPVRELDELQDRVLRALQITPSNREQNDKQSLVAAEWIPAVDITEDEKEYLIKVELSEVNREDVKVTLDNGMVVVRGERKLEKEENNKKFHRIERSYGTFMRSFALPADADPAGISAEFKDGVLQVRLAKCEDKLPRQIEVLVN